MKKTITCLSLFFGGVCLCLGSLSAEPVKIGLVLKDSGAFWATVEKGARAVSEANGCTLLTKAPPAEADISIQAQLVISLVKHGAGVIIAAPASREAMRPALQAAVERGIKVVIIDAPLDGIPGSVYVGTDQLVSGQAAGALLQPMLKDKAEFGLLRHAQGNPATTQREDGASAVLRSAYPALVIHGDIYASVEKDQELAKATLLLEKYPEVRAVLCSGTGGTMAMIKALQSSGKAGKVGFVGFGFNCNNEAAAALQSGLLSGWIAQQPEEVGRKSVEAALKLIRGESQPAVQYVPFLVVTKENLSDPKIQAFLR